jgi:hypothetical protein
MREEVCTVNINSVPFQCNVSSASFFWGEDQILYQEENSVISKADWKDKGFSIVDVLQKEEYEKLKTITTTLMKGIVSQHVSIDDGFSLQKYHTYVTSDEIHQRIIQQTRFLKRHHFSPLFETVAEKISSSVGYSLSLDNFKLDEEIIILRISRPQSLDINPPHRDGYLPIWADVLNVWLPVEGCNEKSSLPVIEGSHLWNEKDIYRTEAKGAQIVNRSYHVPAIVQSSFGLNMTRPNPSYEQALIFTPFLLHGCAVNMNDDITRFSFELRLTKSI